MKFLQSHVGFWFCGFVFGSFFAGSSFGADWPSYKHDGQRSSVTADEVSLPLHLAWEHRCAQPPAPAWPPPGKLINRTDFDYAPHPVIAQGIVCFGSSSDDTVRALDAKTGAEKWHFITGGPVRFAPQIENGKVFFASDDGFVYCLEAGTGKTVWKFQAALRDERMIGNHRMISRWPVRTGVLVADGVVYCVAGMWDMEEVFVHALQADTGKIVWCNDTTGFIGVSMVDMFDRPDVESALDHQGEFGANARNGNNPQGPMLISGNILLVANGNADPRALDRRTGAPIPWNRRAPGGSGGTWLTVDGEKVSGFSKHHSGELLIVPRSVATGEMGRPWGKTVVPQLEIMPRKPFHIGDRGKVSAIVHKGKLYARNAYGMALAGATLLIGEDGAVVAQDPETARELWRTGVDGEAREIAVADGRLFVGTSTGMIYCFEGGSGVSPLRVSEQSGGGVSPLNSSDQRRDASATILAQLHQAGMDRGFALVVGDPDGKLSMELAAQTQLRVINALTDETAATALREKLLAQTAWYGSRIHVHTVKQMDQLPFAQYFANAVIVAGPAAGITGKELYRVLRPCGGILLLPGLKPAETETLVKSSGATEKEIQRMLDRQSLEGCFVVRGKLPGARDWNSGWQGLLVDQRVKWPLRPLWFGGPSTAQVQNLQQGVPGPVVANGRYFLRSERFLTAVDAYNGAVLWSRSIPQSSPDWRMVDGVIHPVSEPTRYEKPAMTRGLTASDDFVYLQLGAAYFQGKALGKEEGRIQLDARTGEQKKLTGPVDPPTPFALKTPQKWAIEVDPQRSGAVAMELTERGLLLTLTTKDPLVTKLDAWELCFDFRPPETRYGLYERGTFHVRVAMAQDKNGAASWIPGAGPAHPKLEVTGTREPDGTKTSVVVPWTEIQKLTGAKPSGFDFAATLDSHDGGKDEPLVRRHLFGDWTADGLNNGWARATLDEAATTVDVAKAPAIMVASLKEERPAGSVVKKNESQPPSWETLPRIHPLTGEPEPKMYRNATRCGAPTRPAGFLSGGGGINDFADDSGMRPLGGVKSRCHTAQVAALGLLLVAEESGHCECTYPVRTSLVLAPAEKRLNEDWAFFFDREADTRVRQASINLGAPGDRRDDSGTLWLGYPRLPGNKSLTYPVAAGKERSVGANGVWFRVMPAVLQVPLEVECFGGAAAYHPGESLSTNATVTLTWSLNPNQKEFGPQRVNADRADIRGTDRPWIYASCYRGIKKAVLKLNILPPLVSPRAEKPPALNGKPDVAAWQGGPQARLPFTKTVIFLRHDDANLYVAARRPAVVDRLGKILPWSKTTSGSDANVWEDDSFEVFLGGHGGERVMHLGVAASGARYDALAGGGDDKPEDRKWTAPWTGAIATDETGLVAEVTIPWQTIEAAGLKKDQLGINCQMNQKDVSGESFMNPGLPLGLKTKETGGEALCYLGIEGRDHCRNFASLSLGTVPKIDLRSFTVRLHFAELDDVKPGQRVFDVKLQDQVVLKDFDVVKEAGGARTALVKEFKNVRAGEALTLEFTVAGKEPTAATAPILSAIEVVDEDFKVAAKLGQPQ